MFGPSDSQCPCCKNPWVKTSDGSDADLSCMQCGPATVPKVPATLAQRLARFEPVTLGSPNLGSLPATEHAVLRKLFAASREMEAVYLKQKWAGTSKLLESLPAGSEVARYAAINKGPWCELDRDCFVDSAGQLAIPPTPPPNANLYPDDMTKEEFEAWALTLGESDAAAARGFFHVIRRRQNGEGSSSCRSLWAPGHTLRGRVLRGAHPCCSAAGRSRRYHRLAFTGRLSACSCRRLPVE